MQWDLLFVAAAAPAPRLELFPLAFGLRAEAVCGGGRVWLQPLWSAGPDRIIGVPLLWAYKRGECALLLHRWGAWGLLQGEGAHGVWGAHLRT